MYEKEVKELKKTDGRGLDILRRRSKRWINKKGKGSQYNRAAEKRKNLD